MKQKNSFCCLVVAMMIVSLVVTFISCGDDDSPNAMLEVSPENLQLNDSGEGTLTITSNTKWEVSTTADWLMFSTMSGVGNGQVTVRANGNSMSDRTAIVTVKGEDISRQAVVTHEAVYPPMNFIVDGVKFNMIFVEGGTFFMGATAEQLDDADDDEKPTHSVTLHSYYIGETVVTQNLWQIVTGLTPTADGWQWNNEMGLGANYPANYISWNDCQEFITKLNTLTGRTFRMPTEAEWEFAARGGTKSKGYLYAGSNNYNDVVEIGWGTYEVATKQPNELGIYDMSGNVCEWCSDWYDSDYYSSSPSDNPAGPAKGSYRVLRGGDWFAGAKDCRVSSRSWSSVDDRPMTAGIRLVLQ